MGGSVKMTDYTDYIAFVITLVVVIVGCILNNTTKVEPLLPVYRPTTLGPASLVTLMDVAVVDAESDRVI